MIASMPSLPSGESAVILVIAVPIIYFAMVFLGRRLKRRDGVRLGLMYQLFAITLAFYLPVTVLDMDFPNRTELGSAVILLGAVFVNALLKRFLFELHYQERRQASVPKFLSEVVALLVVVVAFILVLAFGYDVRIPGLLTGSGIAAVIIGLAMQDLLGNIIAGFAIHFGKPFRAGDWLIIDNKHAEVVEVNWRSTRMRTNDDVYLDIPNREIARLTIVNLHYPTRRHALRITVGVDYSAPPTRVKDILIHATANAVGVSGDPRIKVFLKNFGDSAVEYEVKFWVDDHAIYNEVTDAIRTNIWYSLKRHGIKIPFPMRTVQIERSARSHEQEMQNNARNILRQQPLFQCLDDAQLDALLPRGRLEHFGRGEKLIQQGEDGASMFILVNGEANVVVDRDGDSTQVARLRAGDCFGEMSLLTGEKRSATVVAQTDCEVVEIGKPVLANSLKQQPELLNKLSELLARRQLETEGILAENTSRKAIAARQTEYAVTFLDKLRTFFEL
ncbi:MAG: mechanosensitive ion channel [Verrucomicrobia bacterium]|nr:mechanosensitive ion channel [Verrucomicrobiota bacterium]